MSLQCLSSVSLQWILAKCQREKVEVLAKEEEEEEAAAESLFKADALNEEEEEEEEGLFKADAVGGGEGVMHQSVHRGVCQRVIETAGVGHTTPISYQPFNFRQFVRPLGPYACVCVRAHTHMRACVRARVRASMHVVRVYMRCATNRLSACARTHA